MPPGTAYPGELKKSSGIFREITGLALTVIPHNDFYSNFFMIILR